MTTRVVSLGGEMPDNEDQILPIRSSNKKMRESVKIAKLAAPTKCNLVLYGETGVGKEVFARAIHRWSDRSKKPFIAVNCAAFPDTLIESELFGTVKGAYTGATDRPGLFEQADGGTLLLDEIAEMSLPTQPKLLRVLQEKQLKRLGGTKYISVNVRIIAATNKNLLQEIQRGTFRLDLYHRIATVRITLPPLRERKDDLLSFVNHFLAKFSRREGKIYTINDSVLQALQQYHWPGNIRELEHMLDGATALCDGKTILPEHLLFEEFSPLSNPKSTEDDKKPRVGLVQTRDTNTKITREIFLAVWKECNKNVRLVASHLGRSTRTVYRWIKKYGLKPIEKHMVQFPEALSP